MNYIHTEFFGITTFFISVLHLILETKALDISVNWFHSINII